MLKLKIKQMKLKNDKIDLMENTQNMTQIYICIYIYIHIYIFNDKDN